MSDQLFLDIGRTRCSGIISFSTSGQSIKRHDGSRTELMTPSILIAASEPQVGSSLSSSIRNLGWSVAGPFRRNADALDWLGDEQADCAILDIMLNDGSAFQLAAALYRAGTPLVFFSDFNPGQNTIRAEFPRKPGVCREAQLSELLSAFHEAVPNLAH